MKVTFLNGSSLDPVPSGGGKDPDARWLDIYEGELDEGQMADWVRQSAGVAGVGWVLRGVIVLLRSASTICSVQRGNGKTLFWPRGFHQQSQKSRIFR